MAGTEVFSKQADSNHTEDMRRGAGSVAMSSKSNATHQEPSSGNDANVLSESKTPLVAKQSRPRDRRTKKQNQDHVVQDQSNPSKFKPLNFAPPPSAINSAVQRPKKNKQLTKANVALLENSDPPKTRKIRVRRDKSPTKLGQNDVDKVPSVATEQTKAPFKAPESTLPKFAATEDPFPDHLDGLVTETASMILRDNVDHSPAETKNDISNSSNPTKPKKKKQLSKEPPQLEQKPKRIRPDRRARSQKEQLPVSMFVDQTVSRGLHGRLRFSPVERSGAQDNGSSVVHTRPDNLEQENAQREQYQSGPGLMAQERRNKEADVELLQYQKRSALNFAPPQNGERALNGSTDPSALSPSMKKEVVSKSTSSAKTKKSFFADHVTVQAAKKGLENGTYLRGQLRISPKSRNDAWVTITSKNAQADDVLVEGERNRNRALSGDEVVLEIISEDVPSRNNTNERDTRDNQSNEQEKNAGRTKGRVVFISQQRPLQRISGFIRPPGWVVGVKKQDERALIANEANKNSCTFHPQDQRIPWLTIGQYDLPKELQGPNWIFNILQKQRTIYAARIVAWQTQSRTPRGTIVDELGVVGNINTETAAILADCDVDVRDHPATALLCLPDTPWSISEEEVSKRRDFRRDRVCTIDPETARDLDDALSVRKLEDGNYEIGVHIADVSHFIKQGNALDRIAQDRATTVYMVQKAIPMLPRLLCEELCSLNPAVDRLAFSVTWTMNELGEEVGPRWYGRSIIRSAVRFAYGEAQNLLDGQSWAEGVGKAIDGGHTEEEITNDVKVLLKMSKAMRARRFENGALTINAFKLNFKLNQDGIPGVAEVYQLKDANRLIEEFMLKANISVAEKIVDAFPEHALLRKHPPPKDRPLKEFVQYAEKLGIHIDSTSSATMQAGFNRLAEVARDNPMVGVLQNNAVRSMRRAEYMCTGLHEDSQSWGHYALAVPLYTHFTSPIRRYADVVVHRLLDRALKQSPAGFDADECEEWAKNCNVRKENARTAQDRSSMLYLCAFIEATCRKTDKLGTDTGMEVDAVVIAVRDRSIDLIVPGMALEKRIYYDSSHAIETFVHDEEQETTEITWRSNAERLAAIKAEEDEADGTGDDTEGQVSTDGEPLDGRAGRRVTTRIAVMDKIRVWLRGDFEVSPCQVNAGFVRPQGPSAAGREDGAEPA